MSKALSCDYSCATRDQRECDRNRELPPAISVGGGENDKEERNSRIA